MKYKTQQDNWLPTEFFVPAKFANETLLKDQSVFFSKSTRSPSIAVFFQTWKFSEFCQKPHNWTAKKIFQLWCRLIRFLQDICHLNRFGSESVSSKKSHFFRKRNLVRFWEFLLFRSLSPANLQHFCGGKFFNSRMVGLGTSSLGTQTWKKNNWFQCFGWMIFFQYYKYVAK